MPKMTQKSVQRSLSELLEATEDGRTLSLRPVELDPELKKCIQQAGGGSRIDHPLIPMGPYDPSRNELYNAQLRSNREQLLEAEGKRDWLTYLLIHEPDWRLTTFLDMVPKVDDASYWQLLGCVYTDAEVAVADDLYWRLFDSRRGLKDQLMLEQERQLVDELPDEFVVYRGYSSKGHRRGLSWSLDYSVARGFGDRNATWFGGSSCVIRAWACKSQVHAVFTRRNELEVVVRPNLLRDIRIVRRPCRPAWLQSLWKIHADIFSKRLVTRHGPCHWFKVEKNGLAIAKRATGCDVEVIRAFAVLHDCRRLNEEHDPKHGARAAALCKKLHRAGDLPLSRAQLDLLVHACAHHTDGDTSSDPTIGACWDADRLDLIRVGVIPDQKFFSSVAAFGLRFRT